MPTHLQFLFTWGLLVFLSGDEEDNHLFIWWVSFSTFFSILFWHDVCAWEQKSFLMSPSMGIVCIFRRLRCNDASIYSEKESDTKNIIHWHLFVISLIIICGQTNYKKNRVWEQGLLQKYPIFFSPQTLLSVSTKTSVLFLFQQTLYTEYLQETVSEHDLWWVMKDVQTFLANGFFITLWYDTMEIFFIK